MRANNDVLLLTWRVLSKEDPDSLEDHKDRKWPFEKVPDVETASFSVILVISSKRILNGIRRRNNEVPSLSRAEGFVSPIGFYPELKLKSDNNIFQRSPLNDSVSDKRGCFLSFSLIGHKSSNDLHNCLYSYQKPCVV